MLLNFKMCQFLHDFVSRRSSKLLFCYYLRNSVSLRARSGRKLILSTFRPWIVWDVSRTKTNSNKNCSNLITIPVNINFLLHFFMGNNPISCNAEKVIYFLLLDRKQRKPSFEDETEVLVRARCGSSDPPRKRVDHCKLNGVTYNQLSQGSPITPRRNLYRSATKLQQLIDILLEQIYFLNLYFTLEHLPVVASKPLRQFSLL